ncbi:UNVERIFIED_CONTAM: putative folate-biopterin transporter 7 [Sesamum calycinum]|uniref:Folate-biopterin transporter 7 n=1 Tax=Sesamum calycinum TaxID=2727403 RepID=A0AAW2SZF8_9LAMI
MVAAVSQSESGRNRKLLLGIGYLVQGLRCFPWMGVIFFLKDGLRVEPSTLQILQNSANLPMVAKPFYGILSDSFYIFGQHRVSLILPLEALMTKRYYFFHLKQTRIFYSFDLDSSSLCYKAFLQALSWIAIAISGKSGISFFSITFYLLLSNLGASIVEVANDAMVAETAKQRPSSKKTKPSSSGELQSFVWMASSIGGVVGNLIGTMFYYQTEHLKIESSVLGISKVFGQAAMLLWGVVYNRHLKSISSRKLITAVQVSMAIFMISDFLFVKGVYQQIGLPDSVYVVLISGVLEVLYFFKILPFSVLMAKLCPPGCEGSVMAFVMSAIALAFIVSGYFGVALASYVGVNGDDFSGLPQGLLIQAACTLLPIFWASWIPEDVKLKGKQN